MIKIINYAVGGSKKEPFVSWVDDLDLKTQSVVYARLDRVILGNFGDCKQLKDGDGMGVENRLWSRISNLFW